MPTLQMTEKVANLEAEHERQLEQLVEMAGAGETITATHRALAERLEESLNVSRKRLSVLEANAARRSEEREQEAGRSKEELLDALKAVLTEEIPKDDGRRARRQAILECCLSKIVVHDVASGDGTSSDATPSGAGQDPYDGKGYEIELFGPLVPKTIVEGGSSGGSGRSGGSSSSAYNTLPVSPLDAAGHLLEAELRESEATEGRAEGAAVGHGNSSTQVEETAAAVLARVERVASAAVSDASEGHPLNPSDVEVIHRVIFRPIFHDATLKQRAHRSHVSTYGVIKGTRENPYETTQSGTRGREVGKKLRHSFERFESERAELIERAKDTEPALIDAVRPAAKLYARLIGIHPFVDGNGRTGFCVLAHSLVRCEAIAVALPEDETKEFHWCLGQAMRKDRAPDYEPLAQWIAEQILASTK